MLLSQLRPPPGLPEQFPYFNWKLFPSAPGEVAGRIELWVSSINGTDLSTDLFFYDLDTHFRSARDRDVRVSKALSTALANTRRGDEALIKRECKRISDRFMPELRSVEFKIVRSIYHPIDRFRNQDILSQIAILKCRVDDEA